MKKINCKNLITAIFIAICLVPSLGMLVFGESEAAANEVLSAKPALTERDGSFNADFLSDLSDCLADRFALRQEMITVWSQINAKLFNTSAVDDVILGKNGELFYADTVDDYTGTGLSDGQLMSGARNLYLLQEYCYNQGAEFVFTVAPNKNSLYGENMPESFDCGHETSNAVRLEVYLQELGVNYCSLFDTLSAADEKLYYDTDSHWNSKGAALGGDAVLKSLGIGSNYYGMSFTAGRQHTGDLYEMLYPAGKRTETDLVPETEFSFTTKSDPKDGEAMVIESECASGTGNLMCWRDSFGIALYPYLCQSFSSARLSRSSTYDVIRLEGTETGYVIIELVERHISRLVTIMPAFPAPERQLTAEKTAAGAAFTYTEGKSATQGLTLVECTAPEGSYTQGDPAYIACGEKVYEACVIYRDSSAEPVFSAWIETDAAESAALILLNGETPVMYTE